MTTINKGTPLNSRQIPLCQVCRLEPLPQSTQYITFMIAELLCIFINIKFSIILLLLGYFFAKTIWICPMCKREVAIPEQIISSSTNEHIIIRLSDCMALVSKLKFRIVAGIGIMFMVYLFITEPSIKPKIQVQKNWRSVAANSGLEMYLENSFKANYFYEKFQNSGDWQLTGIFLSRDNPGIRGHVTMKVKMDPSQFSEPQAQDFHVLVIKPQFEIEKGEEIKLYGNWGKRKLHIMVFDANRVQKTGKKVELQKIGVLGKGYLREGIGY